MTGALSLAAEAVRQHGRYGDTELVHLGPEELALLERQWGPATFNPVTGLPEHFSFGQLLKYALPVVASLFAPGLGESIGTTLGASASAAPVLGNAILGAGLGALSGGNAKSALLGGALSGLTTAAAPTVKDWLGGNSAGSLTPGSMSLGSDFGAEDFNPNIPHEPLAVNVGGAGGYGTEDFVPGASAATGGWGSYGAEDFVPGVTSGTNLGAVAAASPLTTTAAGSPGTEPSFWQKYKTPLLLGGGALLLGGASEQPRYEPPAVVDTTDHSPLPEVAFDRTYAAPADPMAYYTFGSVPFQFYDNNYVRTQQDGEEQDQDQGYAHGGPLAYVAGGSGPGDGRADTVPARLSNNEYVMDAETVALLGNGSPDAGAKKLDELRRRLRVQKGRALVKGQLSPKAKAPEAYLRGEG